MASIIARINEPHKAFLRYAPTNTVYLIGVYNDAYEARDKCDEAKTQYNCSNTLFVESDSDIHLDAQQVRVLNQSLAIVPTLVMIGSLVAAVVLGKVL